MREILWEPYFKPTKRVRNSRFNCIECGYIKISNAKVIQKVIIAWEVNHVYNFSFPHFNSLAEHINIDLTKDGCFRVYSLTPDQRLYWDIPDHCDAVITTHKWMTDEEIDHLWHNQKKEKGEINETL